MFMGKRDDMETLKAAASRKGFLTPEEILSVYPKPENNLDEIEQLLGLGIELAEKKQKEDAPHKAEEHQEQHPRNPVELQGPSRAQPVPQRRTDAARR